MDTLQLLQHYWWFVISLLGALLVFLLFVQGGQGLLYAIGRDERERTMIVNVLGRKWETTFTTLVTFGGAFFASFPLFYSTSFGGACYVWFAILLVFVIQAVAYEFRRKPSNLLGERTYEAFLQINGIAGALLLGVAVATLFTGADFTVDRFNIADAGGNTAISRWTSPWHGLEALADWRNWALGLAVLFLSRLLALHYFMNTIDDETIFERSRRRSLCAAMPMVVSLLLFLGAILLSEGYRAEADGRIVVEPMLYLHNFAAMPYLAVTLAAGVGAVHMARLARLAQGDMVERCGYGHDGAGAAALGGLELDGVLSVAGRCAVVADHSILLVERIYVEDHGLRVGRRAVRGRVYLVDMAGDELAPHDAQRSRRRRASLLIIQGGIPTGMPPDS